MKNKFKLLYNPFDRVAGWKAFFIGLVIVSVSVIIACYGNQYYQGIMNIKLVPDTNLGYAFLSQAIGLLSAATMFFAAGLIFSKGVRFQDVLGTITLARYPYIIPAFLGYLFDFDSMNKLTTTLLSGSMENIAKELTMLTIIGFVMLIILVWYVALLWNAFRVSTGIKGGKGIAVFIVALIMSDLLYYVVAYLINKLLLI